MIITITCLSFITILGITIFVCVYYRWRRNIEYILNKHEIKINSIQSNDIALTPDKYFKSLTIENCENMYNCNFTFSKNTRKNATKLFQLDYPKFFIPDLVLLYNNTCLVVEYDEGGDFHSKTYNINYIMKWIQYNKYLIDNDINVDGKHYKFSLIRITYPTGWNSHKLNAFWPEIKTKINNIKSSNNQH